MLICEDSHDEQNMWKS